MFRLAVLAMVALTEIVLIHLARINYGGENSKPLAREINRYQLYWTGLAIAVAIISGFVGTYMMTALLLAAMTVGSLAYLVTLTLKGDAKRAKARLPKRNSASWRIRSWNN